MRQLSTGSEADNWALPAVLLLAVALYTCQFGWGLPNGNLTWSADAVQPITPLAVAHASFTRGWNSGWFYYKYPLAHFFVLCAVYAPYLAWLRLSGKFGVPQSEYPYGFVDPESALLMLAILGRVVTLFMALGTVWVLFRIGQRLWGARGAAWSAAAAAALPPMVYYAHTTNLDLPQLFWMTLAWYAALRLLDAVRVTDLTVFAAASGMALATRESAYAWLLGLAALVLFAHFEACVQRQLGIAAAVWRLAGGVTLGMLVFFVASNGLYNPLGFWRRLLYMTGHLPEDVLAEYVARAPLVLDRLVPDASSLAEMISIVAWSMGFPWLVLSIGGLIAALWKKPRAAVCTLVPTLAYFLSVAGFPSLAVRYLLPATVGFAFFGGWAACRIWERGRAGRTIVVIFALFTLVHGGGVDYLLANDPRYQLEAWLRENARPGTRLETYHEAPYLPRYVEGVTIAEPPFAEITRAGIVARRPDLVLISPANMKRITQRYHKTRPEPIRPRENALFLEALLAGELPYRKVAEFHVRWPLLPEVFIPTLNPPLLVLAREGATEKEGPGS